MARGFAGGLAEGLNQGMQIYAMDESLKSRRRADERAEAADLREQETHAQKMREMAEVRNMTAEWAKELGWNPPAPGGSPVNPNAPSMGGLAATPNPSDVGMSGLGNTPSNVTPTGGLGMPQQEQQQATSPGEYIQKQVIQGDAFSNPEKLNRLAAIAFANNQGQMGIQFLNQVHNATQKGWTQALGRMAAGDGKGAATILKNNGVDIRGEMTPVEGKEHTWKANIGGQEREISARDLFMSSNPEKAYEMHLTGMENKRKAELEEKKLALQERKTQAEIGALGARGEKDRALARRADRAPELKATRSSSESIEKAIDRRDKQFEKIATVTDEFGTEQVDRDLLRAYADTSAQLQSFIEEGTGEELGQRDHHKLTDEMLRFPVDGSPQEKAAATRAVLRRFGLDLPEEERRQEPEALSGRAPERAAPAPALGKATRKEPTQEERELESLKGKKNYPTLINDLKRLQKERHAVNLNAKQKAEVEAKIKAILKEK